MDAVLQSYKITVVKCSMQQQTRKAKQVMNTNIQHGNPFEEGWILDECEAIRRAERHEDRVYSESLPGVYPPCNPIKPTVLAVISGRSEDGTMFYSKGGMWSSYIESHCVMNYSI